jgi:hypothetical protein
MPRTQRQLEYAVKHDDRCELDPDSSHPTCHCAERTYLATATPEERDAWKKRSGYDSNRDARWGTPPRRLT